MWENFKNKLHLRFKTLEFRLQTWKNAREISKAYNRSVAVKPVKSFSYKKIIGRFFRVVFSISVVLVSGVLTFYGASKLLELYTSYTETAAVKLESLPPVKSSVEKSSLDNVRETTVDSTIKDTGVAVAVVEENILPVDVVDDVSYEFVIVANKAYKQMYLIQKTDKKWKIARNYEVAIGAQEGQKQSEGDKRTPEGTYFICGRKEGYELSSIYGPMAYILNYPNKDDINEARTGSGIWIHGTEKDSVPYQTRGCLELANENLLELSSFLKRGLGTPVVIVNSLTDLNPLLIPDYSALDKKRAEFFEEESVKIEQFRNFLVEWKTAWESKNIDLYRSFYDTTRFKGQGLTWEPWEKRKVGTFEIYQHINISIDSTFISEITSDYAVVKFLQKYETDKNRIEDGKVLHLINDENSWKIILENTCPKEEILL